MAQATAIEWADAVWNPIVGCSIVSPGCTHCYAMRMARRLDRPGSHYHGTTQVVNGRPVWTGKIALAPERTFLEPLGWRRPRWVFVNSMGDLFHGAVPQPWIDRAYAVMALCPHFFIVLTKRPDLLAEYTNCGAVGQRVWEIADDIAAARNLRPNHAAMPYLAAGRNGAAPWPLPNVVAMTSIEDQRRADERMLHLLSARAAVYGVSAEPLLGPVDLSRWMPTGRYFMARCPDCGHIGSSETWGLVSYGDDADTVCPKCESMDIDEIGRLGWAIVGGESGPGARPMHPDWATDLRDQCLAASVPFFFKQWGNWSPFGAVGDEECVVTGDGRTCAFNSEAMAALDRDQSIVPAVLMRRVGKRRAGRLLDGREWNQVPGTGFPVPGTGLA